MTGHHYEIVLHCPEREAGDRWRTFEFVSNDPEADFAKLGFPVTGRCFCSKARPELRGQPVATGLCGPMWGGEKDGHTVIRYENASANHLLSI